MDKPITLVKQDFVKSITELINDSCLPPIILEPIFKDFYNDMKLAANRQLAADSERWNNYLLEKNGDGDEIS